MSLLNVLIGPISGLLDKFIPDKDKRDQLAHDIATMAEKNAFELAKFQLEVNKAEAAHKSLFVAGWRPAVGWVCVLGMAGNFLLIPMANFVLNLRGVIDAATGAIVQIPLIDTATMMPVLMGMLGLGVMRTFEKTKGVAREK